MALIHLPLTLSSWCAMHMLFHVDMVLFCVQVYGFMDFYFLLTLFSCTHVIHVQVHVQ